MSKMTPTGPSRSNRHGPNPRNHHHRPHPHSLHNRRSSPDRHHRHQNAHRPPRRDREATPPPEKKRRISPPPATDPMLDLPILDPAPAFDINTIGPHPGYIMQSVKFVSEWEIQQQLKKLGTELKDEQWRIQGVSLMEQANGLLLKAMPMFTLTTATAFFHRFRLANSMEQHHLLEVVASSLYLASKTENTAQKPNQIAAACFNVNTTTSEKRQPEDDFFDAMSDRIVDLERLILEATHFEFNYHDPKRAILEILSDHFGLKFQQGRPEDDDVIRLALELSKDLSYTFATIKQPVLANAAACVELAMRMSERGMKWESLVRVGREIDDNTQRAIERYESKWGVTEWLRDTKNPYRIFLVKREHVSETIFDLMDLYTVHRTATHAGKRFTNEQIMQLKISLNRIARRFEVPRYCRWPKDEASAIKAADYVEKLKLERDMPIAEGENDTGPQANAEKQQLLAVKRFVLQGSDAREERGVLDEFFLTREEDYDKEHDEEDGWESVASDEEDDRAKDSKR